MVAERACNRYYGESFDSPLSPLQGERRRRDNTKFASKEKKLRLGDAFG